MSEKAKRQAEARKTFFFVIFISSFHPYSKGTIEFLAAKLFSNYYEFFYFVFFILKLVIP